MSHFIRLHDFNVLDTVVQQESDDSNDEDTFKKYDVNEKEFMVQMYGIDENRTTYAVNVTNFKPFFYILVNEHWNENMKSRFVEHIHKKLNYRGTQNYITQSSFVSKQKLYGFDHFKKHNFILLEFQNYFCFNKVKNLWYCTYEDQHYDLLPNGYVYTDKRTNMTTNIMIYESNILPLLRMIHITNISPSGWIEIPETSCTVCDINRRTACEIEITVDYKDIRFATNKETRVPYNTCSFDIEADSSHGEFPLPVKSYKKLATEIVININISVKPDVFKEQFTNEILTAFGYASSPDIHLVYPKTTISESNVIENIQKTFQYPCDQLIDKNQRANRIQEMFESYYKSVHEVNTDVADYSEEMSEFGVEEFAYKEKPKDIITSKSRGFTIIDILLNREIENEEKIDHLNVLLSSIFPPLNGDRVTFIGSTFMTYGDSKPHMQHCIVLNGCGKIPDDDTNSVIIECYDTEREVLLAWQRLIQREDPDIMIGYNIFGFDYDFMFRRAQENHCDEEFLLLSRNIDEVCGKYDKTTNEYDIERTSITVATGSYELKYIKMNGRIQIDLYNHFRKNEKFSSFKLDKVAGYFIGDAIHELKYETDIDGTEKTIISTNNLSGLTKGSYVHLNDTDDKFMVLLMDESHKCFTISGRLEIEETKRWMLAKDDVDHKDIFRLSKGSDEDRAIVAKYCIQDCNLVQYLFDKVDILTGFIEMSFITSVPLNLLITRGQGIKVTSCVFKKCRLENILIPVLKKVFQSDGYEGAINLEPKRNLYTEDPVATLDFASLYPMCINTENFSQDSKVWTKEYDLEGNIINITGERDSSGNFIYDNLPDYEYNDAIYDTFKYVRKTPKSKAEKIKSGYKICRFAQYPDNKVGILPNILIDLLSARKATRKLLAKEKDEFMQQVLEKRQLGYKLTANSIYGQCGFKSSTIYDKDVAASTTATGRKLIMYAVRIVEEVYKNRICSTSKYGDVLTNAEYIYGDTDSVFFRFNLTTLTGEKIIGKRALEITIELAQEVGELASSFLKSPHELEYEKTFLPFGIPAKKRYFGTKYVYDPNHGERKVMGMSLVRGDVPPVVKDVFSSVLDIILEEQNYMNAVVFVQNYIRSLIDKKIPIKKLIISKMLRSFYKNPNQIAHAVLAKRIGERDEGNKPASGDRIEYIYIYNSNPNALQGDKIETPSYILENNIKIDYSFYITNQIMKPLLQIFGLVLEDILIRQNKISKLQQYRMKVKSIAKEYKDDKYHKKIDELRSKELGGLIFGDFLRETDNTKKGFQTIDKFFQRKK